MQGRKHKNEKNITKYAQKGGRQMEDEGLEKASRKQVEKSDITSNPL